jgi:hypothetical protein
MKEVSKDFDIFDWGHDRDADVAYSEGEVPDLVKKTFETAPCWTDLLLIRKGHTSLVRDDAPARKVRRRRRRTTKPQPAASA